LLEEKRPAQNRATGDFNRSLRGRCRAGPADRRQWPAGGRDPAPRWCSGGRRALAGL